MVQLLPQRRYGTNIFFNPGRGFNGSDRVTRRASAEVDLVSSFAGDGDMIIKNEIC